MTKRTFSLSWSTVSVSLSFFMSTFCTLMKLRTLPSVASARFSPAATAGGVRVESRRARSARRIRDARRDAPPKRDRRIETYHIAEERKKGSRQKGNGEGQQSVDHDLKLQGVGEA
jgi:hypothetical protein